MIVVNNKIFYFDENDKESFKSFLKEKNITQSEFCSMIGVGTSIFSLIINGERPITSEIATKITNCGFKVILK